jgi:gluconolactonase
MMLSNLKHQSFIVLSGVAWLMIALGGCTAPCKCKKAVKTNGIIAPGAELVEVSAEFRFTEGPAADAAGNVYFTDQPNDQIMIYTTDGRLETFMKPSGRSNGLFFDTDGSLIACADEKNELWRINVQTKEHIVMAQRYEGKLLNAPNDVWVHPKKGWIYFSDPFYKRTWWDRGPTEQPCEGVYRINADGTGLVRVIDDLVKPNGLIGTLDGKTLYVADIQDRKTWAYTIASDGALTNKRLFCTPGSDGMTLDACGNVYLTGDGVLVFDSAGRQIEHIKVPQRWTANVTFGGQDRQTLFITAGPAVYTLKMNVCGIQ